MFARPKTRPMNSGKFPAHCTVKVIKQNRRNTSPKLMPFSPVRLQTHNTIVVKMRKFEMLLISGKLILIDGAIIFFKYLWVE